MPESVPSRPPCPVHYGRRTDVKQPILIAVLPLIAGASFSAQPAPAGPSGPKPQEIVAARQAAFTLTAATFGGMRSVVENGGDVKQLAMGARGLARWPEALPAMFPDGTRLPTSRARPEIWQDRPGFEAKATDFRVATAALAQAAQAGDAAAFKGAYGNVGRTCGGCHESYRVEQAR